MYVTMYTYIYIYIDMYIYIYILTYRLKPLAKLPLAGAAFLYIFCEGRSYRVAPKGGLARGGSGQQHECTRVSCAIFLA